MTTQGRRPGGLTALAVLNFVFSGLGLLGVLALVAVFGMMDTLKHSAANAHDREVLEAFANMPTALWAMMIISSVIVAALLIIAGVGYLKMRRWGRMIGNAYALLSVATQIVEVVTIPSELGGGVGIGTIIGLVYPVLTLIFINTTFKEELSS